MQAGEELESKEARWKRYRLKERLLYGGVDEGRPSGTSSASEGKSGQTFLYRIL